MYGLILCVCVGGCVWSYPLCVRVVVYGLILCVDVGDCVWTYPLWRGGGGGGCV